MTKNILTFIIFIVFYSVSAIAEDLPKFEGVYVQMADGEFIEIPPVAPSGTRAALGSEVNRPLFAGGSKVSMDGAYGKK